MSVHESHGEGAGVKPLEGVRVIELGQLIAGPYCGQILADFGAEVVKVELPGAGDPMRSWGMSHNGKSLSWSVIGRNKRCVTADLRETSGREFVLELVRTADVLIENFRPGTMERFGLGWEDLREENPGIVMVRISGYGQTGPYAQRAGYGAIGEAMGGLRYLTGDPSSPPARAGISIGDMLAGQQGAMGALLALRAREHTGQGQVVDVSIYESVLAMSEALIADYALAGKVRERTGSILPGVAPSNLYPTQDGSYVLIAANQDSVFARLAASMDRGELAQSEKYATHAGRGRHQAELDDLISAWTATQSADELLELLHQHGVPCGRLYTAPDMLADPHFAARESIVSVPDADLGLVPMQNVSPKLSHTPGGIRWTGPNLGAHDDEVRSDVGRVHA